MSTMPTAGSPTESRSGSIAIVVTIAVLSIVGAIGLWQGNTLAVTVIGIPWTAITAGVWLAYGALLVALFIRPSRRAELLGLAVVLAVAWGGLAATDFAARANGAAGDIVVNLSDTLDSTWANVFVAPIVEETLKMLGILLLLLLPGARRLGTTAGMALGALVAASFQVVENWVFTLQEMFNAGVGSTTVLIEMLLLRGVVGVFSHVVYSAAIGAAIGWFLTGPTAHRMRRLAATVGVFVLMVILHSWSNWTANEGQAIMYVLTMGVGLLVLIATFRFARAQDPNAGATRDA